MEMESTRRSFDRSREQAGGGALKKPRLTEDQPNPNGRQFRTTGTTLPPSAARFKVSSERDADSGGAYHPQPPLNQQYHELVSQYKTALAELTFNSKPIITNLTIIAGENVHAAKAIAATVCANILEVPSDQKLPSLYLLDSIVKNIGRDYIKYFAARLPEVYCKAYRQVDASVRASMRHLFGTWRGVFPPQALQIIEKELGFASAVNGSSSSAATSRLDSQSRRSIHINPKILEIQHLQQSSRAKGMATDLTLPVTTSIEDVERPERTTSIVSGRAWVDPAVKMHNIQRTQISDPVHEKKNGPVYGDFEYNSHISRSSGLGIGRNSGRVAEQGHEKPWFGARNVVTETVSGQKNGFGVEHGFPNRSITKPVNVDLHMQQTQSNLSKSSNAVSASWKNSDEEEFMWDMHSRLSDQDAANLSINRKDHWIPDGSEKLAFENQFRKPQGALEAASFDREASSDSQSIEQRDQMSYEHHSSSPWRLKEPQCSGANAGETDGYSATLAGLRVNSAAARLPIRSHVGSSGSGISGNTSSGTHQILAQQRFQSPGSAYPNPRLQHSAEQDLPQLPQQDNKPYQLSGGFIPSNVQPGNLRSIQKEDSSASAPLPPSAQLNRRYPQPRQAGSKRLESSGQTQHPHLCNVPKTGSPSSSGSSAPDHSAPLSTQISGPSSTSSLLAAVMSSGILSNITSAGLPDKSHQDVLKMPSQSNVWPPLPSVPPSESKSPGARITSTSPLLPDNDSSITSDVKKEEEPPSSLGPPLESGESVNKAVNPISNLLSSLVAKGLISASKPETSSSLPPESPTESQKQNPSSTNSGSKLMLSVPASSTSISSTKDEKSFPKPDAKSTEVSQPASAEMKCLLGLKFKPDVIRELHPLVISALFDDVPHQCGICGLRLELKERLDRHLEWHALRKPEPDGSYKVTRRWYADSGNWIAGKAGVPFGIESTALTDEFLGVVGEDEHMVPADEDQCVCVLCGKLFEDCYSQKREKWMFKAAVHLPLSSKGEEIGDANENAAGLIVHVKCLSESSDHGLTLTSDPETVRQFLFGIV